MNSSMLLMKIQTSVFDLVLEEGASKLNSPKYRFFCWLEIFDRVVSGESGFILPRRGCFWGIILASRVLENEVEY